MADKQCFIYIVDQGRSMGKHHNGREESDLDFGMRYIWDKIAVTMASERKTFTLGVVGLKTDKTVNHLSEDEEHGDGYNNITIQQEVGQMLLPNLKKLQHNIKPSNTDAGDALSAIIVAIDLIEKMTKKLKYQRKIFLMTNGYGQIDGDGVSDIAEKLNQDNIELVIIGVDFDDADYGIKEEEKDPQKKANEALLKDLTEQCNNAVFGTAAEAVEALSTPVVKVSKPYSMYKGPITLGDPEKYGTAMSIDVERYFRTKAATAPGATSFVVRYDLSASQAPPTFKDEDAMDIDAIHRNDLQGVKTASHYSVNDPNAPGGKKEVQREELAKGYEYGRTAVHISESDENVTKLETKQGFSIIGFVPYDKYERFFNMGPSCVTIAQRANEKAQLALSSLIHALFELQVCIVARLVQKDGKSPELILMMPSINLDLECLIDIPLPFAEDVRTYRFAPLDRVITISGTTLTTHRNIPTEALDKAMSAYVDSMDLTEFGKDDDGQSIEFMPIDDTYNPHIHRTQQAIRRRATKPEAPVGPPPAVLMRFAMPPSELVADSRDRLDKLIAASDVKKVPPRTKGRRRDPIKPLSGIDIDALLNNSSAVLNRKDTISPSNAIPEFKQMIEKATSQEAIQSATDQMSKITQSLITDSTGTSNYQQAIANLKAIRRELIDYEFPEVYNAFAYQLKENLLDGKLGGDRREFMYEIKLAKLGLITSEVSELSEVKEEEASKFYSLKALAIRPKES